MAVDIDPLLRRLSDLAPRFGRARGDLEAIVSRGRAGDFKGVMQNGRLVLETLMRSLVADELKQTPGKAMLEELVAKFRQKGNGGIVPANILAHMGTVQAWGNLSAHDHAGSLDESGVRVGNDEVVASLNSMVAILTWYAEKKGLTPEPTADIATPSGVADTDPTTRERQAAGRVIGGRYRLESRLASGGMGEVYRATHLELGRKLALKLMRAELSNEASFVERFRREAMTASRLGHPHIVDIIDSGSEDGQFYFVMEFLDGETLTSLIDRGPVALSEALELVTQIAEALEVAHRAGVVHRDLKPDNVIVLQRNGKPFIKLVDFGVAKVVTPLDRQLTTHGLVIGTPQYMSPEQAAGTAVDLRADVYALGLILFELLTGHPPLTGETPALVMSAHISAPAPALPASFPSSLRDLVARMLAKRPDARPQSMAEVLRVISTVRRTHASRARPALLAVAGAAVLTLGVVALVRPWSSGPETSSPTVVAQPPAQELPTKQPTPDQLTQDPPTQDAPRQDPPTQDAPTQDPPTQVVTSRVQLVLQALDAGVATQPKKRAPTAKPNTTPKPPVPGLLPADGL